MSDIKGLREISNDPFGKLLTALSKKFSAFLAKDQAEAIENPEDIYSDGQDVESVIKYHTFAHMKKFPLTVNYQSPSEPNDKVRRWIKGASLGNTVPDLSQYNTTVYLFGDPVLVDGAPFDYGISTTSLKSIAMQLNRPTSDLENAEHMTMPDGIGVQIAGIATGVSYFFRLRLFDIAIQGDTWRTLFEKMDDATPNNGVVIKIHPTGKLIVVIKRAGTEYKKETAVGTIAINTIYELWITYAVSGNTIHVYINNVDMTLVNNTDAAGFHTTTTNLDANVFWRGPGTELNGHLYCDMYDFMIFREYVVSATEVGRHFINKWTLANIPFGEVMVSNYFASYGLARVSKSLTLKYNVLAPIVPGSFTTASFTTASFTT